jgi:hypothetical protein
MRVRTQSRQSTSQGVLFFFYSLPLEAGRDQTTSTRLRGFFLFFFILGSSLSLHSNIIARRLTGFDGFILF